MLCSCSSGPRFLKACSGFRDRALQTVHLPGKDVLPFPGEGKKTPIIFLLPTQPCASKKKPGHLRPIRR